MAAQDKKGLITMFPQPDRDEMSGKLANPAQDEKKVTSLGAPDKTDINSFIIIISPQSQLVKNDGILINPNPVENTGSRYVCENSEKGSTIGTGDPFKGAANTGKAWQQASSGDFYSFPESVDSHANEGIVSVITGCDGVERLRLEISGSYRGKEGVF